MNRKILLVEPDFKTKFPPLGLMKISSYHKSLGDKVTFFKGKTNHSKLIDDYWDRIYISTVFTYNWKVTVDTINYYKNLLNGDITKIFIGGILSTLMADELWKETGIMPLKGLLDKPGLLDEKNNIIVDDLIPDYDLFGKLSDQYALIKDSYFGYATRSCRNKCQFCGVPILEPQFKEYKDIKPYVNSIKLNFGEKRDLVLFDNNVLVSKYFKKLIFDILELGFEKGAKLKNKQRRVDFNQGIDARLINETNIKLISKIAIRPLRIAFDHLSLKEKYIKSIKLSVNNGIKNLSNYILYNYKDTPEQLWKRLKINIDLNSSLNGGNDVRIYSYPMKFIPLNSKDRSYINYDNWNWQFLRGVQRILNVLRGAVMPGEDFFLRAFGENEKEFIRILYMPEHILMNRGRIPKKDEKNWISKFELLTNNEKKELLTILCNNRKKNELRNAYNLTHNQRIKRILDFYIIPSEKDESNLSLFEKYG